MDSVGGLTKIIWSCIMLIGCCGCWLGLLLEAGKFAKACHNKRIQGLDIIDCHHLLSFWMDFEEEVERLLYDGTVSYLERYLQSLLTVS